MEIILSSFGMYINLSATVLSLKIPGNHLQKICEHKYYNLQHKELSTS